MDCDPTLREPADQFDFIESPGHSALWALSTVAAHFRVQLDQGALMRDLAVTEREPTVGDIVRAANAAGLVAHNGLVTDKRHLEAVPRPAIIRMKDGRYAVLAHAQGPVAECVYFKESEPAYPTHEELFRTWSGEVILLARAAERESPVDSGSFGFRAILDMMSQYRHAVRQILVASLFVQLFTLATPLLLQVVFDKVLVHSSLSTLVLVFVAMLVVALFDAILQHFKNHTVSYVGSRLDLDLNHLVFDHLFKLPLAYFERTPAGQISSRLREIDTIRHFLIGQGLSSIIEALFALVFLVVLAIYSPSLTAIVAGSIPAYLIMGAIIRPRIRSKVRELSENLAESQQLLVECIVGAHTLKSNAIEPLMQRQWDEKRTRYAAISIETSVLNGHVMNSAQTIRSLTTALIVFFGARAVIAGNMSIGILIAFNMISMQTIGPIIRLFMLWGDFQQVQIAVNRLGDIMRSPVEPVPRLPASLPRMRGAISFRDISFRYAENTPEVLTGISIDVRPGEVIGIVGASGSGKSTLAKLIQRLYLPQRGQILLDGFDITQLHPAWIRSQIRVVLQETLLFNRTIHENIALTAPCMTREHVTAVARLAGADEFISRLPEGYDTKIEERGMGLSGGQRQRIAIARALATNPRILILDEATSAVDYESERIVHNNMKEMIKGRTVIIIAHRLMTVRNCDRIIALAGGSIVEDGTHDELLRRDHGLYRYLWALQSGWES